MAKRGPKGQKLPPNIFWDPGKERYRLRYKDGNGKWQIKSAGKNLDKAKRELAKLRRGASLESTPSRPMTFAEYVDRWSADQERRGRRNVKRERNQLELHVIPVLGDARLEDIRPADIVDLCWDLYESGYKASTITKNLKGMISSVFSHAVFEELCDFNPCASIPRNKLPKVGSNPWPPYKRHEVERLLSDPRIQPDRRMLYALAFFLMERCGEVCGIRFSDWDRSLKPLTGVTVESQYQHQPLKGSRDDYVARRRVPVHPQLEAMLVRWKVSGFEAVYHRPPREDDFIVPRLPPDTRKAQSHSLVWKDLEEEAEMVGVEKLPGRASHGFRKAFITLACNEDEAGAAPEAVIKALSHTSKSQNAFERYRHWSWETFCNAVRCVELDLAEPGQVISLAP